jgi:putative glutamine amidotransferase
MLNLSTDITSKLTIGVTDCSKYDNYAGWILEVSDKIEVVKLSEKDQNFEDVKKCQAILFTGGEDVHPRFYNKLEYLPYCHQSDINEKRDEFELKLMDYANQNKLAILGICRGLQLYNVFAGGTLVPDLPTWGKYNHAKLKNNKDRYHSVMIDPESWLANLLETTKGTINSNHHQAADRVGNGLVVSAFSEDLVPEALEWKDPEGKNFLGLIQWHPERLNDQQSAFVVNIKNAFINAALTV